MDDTSALYTAALMRAAAAVGTTAIVQATALIRQCEGTSLTPYQDSRGRWTIGVGCLFDCAGNPVTAHTAPITIAQADWLFGNVLEQIAPKLAAMVTVPMTPLQTAALLSFSYNEGSTGLQTSTLLREFNAGSTAGAAAQFPRWVYVDEGGQMVVVNGLVRRRALEQAVFLGKVDPAGPMPVPVPPEPVIVGPTTDDLNQDELNNLAS